MIANHYVNLRLKLYLAGVPQPEVVVLEEEGVGPARHVLQVTEVSPIKLASEQTFQKVSFGHFVSAVDVVGVIVQGFEVVEGSRILVEEVPQEGRAASPALPCVRGLGARRELRVAGGGHHSACGGGSRGCV